MICIKDFEQDLKNLGIDYFISDLRYVPDIREWAKENNETLSEPSQPMKLMSGEGNILTMIIQTMIEEVRVDEVIKNLGIRLSVRDNATDIEKKLNSSKKRILYCFLKERARTMKDIGGNEMVEDRWVLNEMENQGIFLE